MGAYCGKDPIVEKKNVRFSKCRNRTLQYCTYPSSITHQSTVKFYKVNPNVDEI
jgi:hypothetical protein